MSPPRDPARCFTGPFKILLFPPPDQFTTKRNRPWPFSLFRASLPPQCCQGGSLESNITYSRPRTAPVPWKASPAPPSRACFLHARTDWSWVKGTLLILRVLLSKLSPCPADRLSQPTSPSIGALSCRSPRILPVSTVVRSPVPKRVVILQTGPSRQMICGTEWRTYVAGALGKQRLLCGAGACYSKSRRTGKLHLLSEASSLS